MKAVRVHQFGGPEVLQCDTNIPIPKPESGTVLIRVKAAGINPVDTYVRTGTYFRKPKLPYIPGYDCAGMVEEVAADVTEFKKGDRVYAGEAVSGTYAEYAVAPVNEVHSLPDDVSFVQGAAIPISYATAYRALRICVKAKPSETVLVHGASGGFGVAAVQIARSYGMKVLGTAGTKRGMEVVSTAGADSVFNHNDKSYIEVIKDKTEKIGGINVIVESAAHINLGNDLTLLAKGGRVAVVGNKGPIEINPKHVLWKEASITGVLYFGATKEEDRETKAAIQGGLEAGWLRPIAGKQFSLMDASQAHKEMLAGSALGKIVLIV